MSTPYNSNTQTSGDAQNVAGSFSAGTPTGPTPAPNYPAPNVFNQDGLPVRPAGHTAMVQVQQKSKWVAFFLCFFLGGLGANNFYMGQTGRGIGKLIGSAIVVFSGLSLLGLVVAGFVFTLLLIWDVVEMILILTGTAGYGHDNHGVPLR